MGAHYLINVRKLVISITIVTCPLHYVNFMGFLFCLFGYMFRAHTHSRRSLFPLSLLFIVATAAAAVAVDALIVVVAFFSAFTLTMIPVISAVTILFGFGENPENNGKVSG